MQFADIIARRDQIYAIADRYGMKNIGVFGSTARGDARADSDVDLLVDYDAPTGMRALGLLAFAEETETLLANPVDVVTMQSLKPHQLARIIPDIKWLQDGR